MDGTTRLVNNSCEISQVYTPTRVTQTSYILERDNQSWVSLVGLIKIIPFLFGIVKYNHYICHIKTNKMKIKDRVKKWIGNDTGNTSKVLVLKNLNQILQLLQEDSPYIAAQRIKFLITDIETDNLE